MTAQMFIAVLCLLAMKYTLDLAGSTRQRRHPRQPLAARIRRAPVSTPKLWVVVATCGVLLMWVGIISDKSSAGLMLTLGITMSHAGVFLAGLRSAEKRRRTVAAHQKATAGRGVVPRTAQGVSTPQLLGVSR